MKTRTFIAATALVLCFLTSSCVREKGFEDRVRDIVEAQLGTLTQKVDSLGTVQAELNDSLNSVKGDVENLSKQSQALTDSIAKVKTALTEQKSWTEGELKKIADMVSAIEMDQARFKADIYARLSRLESRIQKIDVVPDYNDGSVGIGKGDFELSFIIRPDSVAQQVADSIELFKLLATRTLTKSSVQVDTIALKGVSYEKGIVTVTIDGSKFPAEMLDSTRSHSGCLVISDGNSETTSGFFPMTQVRYPEFRDSVCMCVKGTWWATVNCGYKPATKEDLSDGYVYGKLYQFGRAKGCGYGDKWGDNTKGPETVIQTFTENTTANPDDDKFYQGGESGDWYSGTKLPGWPMKSGDAGYMAGRIDNPCPSGWRVPIEAELDTLLGGNNEPPLATAGVLCGAYFNGTPNPENTGVFLPFAGFRQGDNDSFNCRSSESYNGIYWSSKATCLSISEDYAEWCEDNGRAFGYSVRCVQE